MPDLSKLAPPRPANEDPLHSVNTLHCGQTTTYTLHLYETPWGPDTQTPLPLTSSILLHAPFPSPLLSLIPPVLLGAPTPRALLIALICLPFFPMCSHLCSEHVNSPRAQTTCFLSLPTAALSPRGGWAGASRWLFQWYFYIWVAWM